MTSADLIVLVPWAIFGVAIAVICNLLFTRRRRAPADAASPQAPSPPPPEGQL